MFLSELFNEIKEMKEMQEENKYLIKEREKRKEYEEMIDEYQ